jgi:hypothetical protein
MPKVCTRILCASARFYFSCAIFFAHELRFDFSAVIFLAKALRRHCQYCTPHPRTTSDRPGQPGTGGIQGKPSPEGKPSGVEEVVFLRGSVDQCQDSNLGQLADVDNLPSRNTRQQPPVRRSPCKARQYRTVLNFFEC